MSKTAKTRENLLHAGIFPLLIQLADLLSAAIGIWFLLRALREMPAR